MFYIRSTVLDFCVPVIVRSSEENVDRGSSPPTSSGVSGSIDGVSEFSQKCGRKTTDVFEVKLLVHVVGYGCDSSHREKGR